MSIWISCCFSYGVFVRSDLGSFLIVKFLENFFIERKLFNCKYSFYLFSNFFFLGFEIFEFFILFFMFMILLLNIFFNFLVYLLMIYEGYIYKVMYMFI